MFSPPVVAPMRRRRLLGLTAAATAGAAAGCLGGGDAPSDGGDGVEWPSGTYADYETTTVTVEGPEGESRGSVTAAIADDRDKRVLGLSDAESLPDDGGMLFVYEEEGSHAFVMRAMDFPLDILFDDGSRNAEQLDERHLRSPPVGVDLYASGVEVHAAE